MLTTITPELLRIASGRIPHRRCRVCRMQIWFVLVGRETIALESCKCRARHDVRVIPLSVKTVEALMTR